MLSALKPLQTLGRSGERKMAHFKSAERWMQRIPAGLPSGIPGIGDDIDGKIQHAPQFGLHFINMCSTEQI